MIILVSPAKSLDYTSKIKKYKTEVPFFNNKVEQIVKRMRKLSAQELAELMSISNDLAELNRDRFKQWSKDYPQDFIRPAIFAFSGDVYKGLDVHSLTKLEIDYAQKHLLILSGMYGVLKPLDSLQPYRLEMGTNISITNGTKNLYDFWKQDVTDYINQLSDNQVIINLASEEYFKVIDKKKIISQLINVKFYDEKNGKYKIISFFAKKARGLFARYIIKNKIEKVEDLKRFNYNGYKFSDIESTDTTLVFKRSEINKDIELN